MQYTIDEPNKCMGAMIVNPRTPPQFPAVVRGKSLSMAAIEILPYFRGMEMSFARARMCGMGGDGGTSVGQGGSAFEEARAFMIDLTVRSPARG